jgi:hypothetical protein
MAIVAFARGDTTREEKGGDDGGSGQRVGKGVGLTSYQSMEWWRESGFQLSFFFSGGDNQKLPSTPLDARWCDLDRVSPAVRVLSSRARDIILALEIISRPQRYSSLIIIRSRRSCPEPEKKRNRTELRAHVRPVARRRRRWPYRVRIRLWPIEQRRATTVRAIREVSRVESESDESGRRGKFPEAGACLPACGWRQAKATPTSTHTQPIDSPVSQAGHLVVPLWPSVPLALLVPSAALLVALDRLRARLVLSPLDLASGGSTVQGPFPSLCASCT